MEGWFLIMVPVAIPERVSKTSPGSWVKAVDLNAASLIIGLNDTLPSL